MAKFPFGPFDATREGHRDPPWVRLKTIAEYLEDGEPIPAEHAQWLHTAITGANERPSKLLELLGLKKPRGRPKLSTPDLVDIGERLRELVHGEGLSMEKAMGKVLEENDRRDTPLRLSRPQLQRIFREYEKARRLIWREIE